MLTSVYTGYSVCKCRTGTTPLVRHFCTYSPFVFKGLKRRFAKASVGDRHASETCQEGCFTYDLGKFAAEYNGSIPAVQNSVTSTAAIEGKADIQTSPLAAIR